MQGRHSDTRVMPVVVLLKVGHPPLVQLVQLQRLIAQGGQKLHPHRGEKTLDFRLPCRGIRPRMREIDLQGCTTELDALVAHCCPVVCMTLSGQSPCIEASPEAVEQAVAGLIAVEAGVGHQAGLVVKEGEELGRRKLALPSLADVHLRPDHRVQIPDLVHVFHLQPTHVLVVGIPAFGVLVAEHPVDERHVHNLRWQEDALLLGHPDQGGDLGGRMLLAEQQECLLGLAAEPSAAALVRAVAGIEILYVAVPTVGVEPIVEGGHAHRPLVRIGDVVLLRADFLHPARDVPILQTVIEQRENESEAEQAYLFLLLRFHRCGTSSN